MAARPPVPVLPVHHPEEAAAAAVLHLVVVAAAEEQMALQPRVQVAEAAEERQELPCWA
jgi:hypothetical protein